MIKRFDVEKTLEVYSNSSADLVSQPVAHFAHWLAEEIPCLNRQRLRELIISHSAGADFARKIEEGFHNVCKVLDCSSCKGIGVIQRLMHPDFWIEVK